MDLKSDKIIYNEKEIIETLYKKGKAIRKFGIFMF